MHQHCRGLRRRWKDRSALASDTLSDVSKVFARELHDIATVGLQANEEMMHRSRGRDVAWLAKISMIALLVKFLVIGFHGAVAFAPSRMLSRTSVMHQSGSDPFLLHSTITNEDEYDVVVIGAGVGGLSCAALCSNYGLKTLCLEAHDTAGGAAHSFSRYISASKTTPFRFDSGPSLITGLSSKGTNPLRQVLDAIGTADAINWHTYDGWLVHDLADSTTFKLTTGDGGKDTKKSLSLNIY